MMLHKFGSASVALASAAALALVEYKNKTHNLILAVHPGFLVFFIIGAPKTCGRSVIGLTSV